LGGLSQRRGCQQCSAEERYGQTLQKHIFLRGL
jgi:hypothetical protein